MNLIEFVEMANNQQYPLANYRNLLSSADSWAIDQIVQSALAERTEQCAKICDDMTKERQEMQSKIQSPLNKSGIDFQVIILTSASSKIRALNQPENKS